MQQFQNVSLRAAVKNIPEERHLSSEELHLKYNMETINVRLHRLANRVWDKLANIAPNIVEESSQLTAENPQHHYWWNRVDPYVNGPEPEPLYQ